MLIATSIIVSNVLEIHHVLSVKVDTILQLIMKSALNVQHLVVQFVQEIISVQDVSMDIPLIEQLENVPSVNILAQPVYLMVAATPVALLFHTVPQIKENAIHAMYKTVFLVMKIIHQNVKLVHIIIILMVMEDVPMHAQAFNVLNASLELVPNVLQAMLQLQMGVKGVLQPPNVYNVHNLIYKLVTYVQLVIMPKEEFVANALTHIAKLVMQTVALHINNQQDS